MNLDEIIANSENIRNPVVNSELGKSSGDGIAAMLFTSGTRQTKRVISHKNLIANAQALTSAWNWSKHDVLLYVFRTSRAWPVRWP